MNMFRTVLLAALASATVLAQTSDPNRSTDFAFVQVSDSHLSPWVAGTPKPALRGADTIAWIRDVAGQPQQIAVGGAKYDAPAPAFAIHTGDLFEYGVIDDSMQLFRDAFNALDMPQYLVPGNHDNTWNAFFQVMRARHGGVNYGFDQGGIHFICLNSATGQEPVPTLDGATRAWLAAELERVGRATPIILAMHHPLHDRSLAPGEYDTLIDLLRGYNVALFLYGHGHHFAHRDHDGIDGVMGGSTYGGNAGYNLIAAIDGRLHVAYCFQKPQQADGKQVRAAGWQLGLDKPLRRAAPPRVFDIAQPAAAQRVTDRSLRIRLNSTTDSPIVAVGVTLDGEPVETVLGGDALAADLTLPDDLSPGLHRLTVRVRTQSEQRDLRTTTFDYAPADAPAVAWRQHFPAGFKAAPIVVGEHLILAGTDGVVRAVNARSGVEAWTYATGVEILATPLAIEDRLIVATGAGEVLALSRQGELQWRYETGGPAVYSPPVAADRTLYFGDNGGHVHAVKLADGSRVWRFARADYAIESSPLLVDDQVIVGAWDGYLYGIDRATGQQRWKQLGPKSSLGKGIRYYGPADCPAVALGARIYVCDRGYLLGVYQHDGKMLTHELDEGVAAIAADLQRGQFAGRKLNNQVFLRDADGEVIWEVDAPAGRFPAPPTLTDDAVIICSNGGRLTVLDRDDGRARLALDTTAGFYVMAPVAADDDICYVAAMDGTVTAVMLPATLRTASKTR